MRGSWIFPRMISGLAFAACVGVLVSVCQAQVIGPVVLTKTFIGGPVRPGLLLLFGLVGLAAWWGLQRGHVPPPASA